MSRFIRKISFWNEETDHYEFSNDFNETIFILEDVYNFNDSEWEDVKQSNDFNMLADYLTKKGIEVELDMDKEIKYLGKKEE